MSKPVLPPAQEVKRPEADSTPFYVGEGVRFTGVVEHNGTPKERAVIVGEFVGDITWNGVLHIPAGGILQVKNSVKCRELLVAGRIVGDSEAITIEAGLLRLAGTACVDVSSISLPIGGLEQARGSRINARLVMTDNSPYSRQECENVTKSETPIVPVANRFTSAPALTVPSGVPVSIAATKSISAAPISAAGNDGAAGSTNTSEDVAKPETPIVPVANRFATAPTLTVPSGVPSSIAATRSITESPVSARDNDGTTGGR